MRLTSLFRDGVTVKEANETGYWLERLYRTGYLTDGQYKALETACSSIRVMHIPAVNTAKKKQAQIEDRRLRGINMFEIKQFEKEDGDRVISFERELREQEPNTCYRNPDETYRKQPDQSFEDKNCRALLYCLLF